MSKPTGVPICTELFAHSLERMKTVETNIEYIKKMCPKCSYEEVLPHSQRNVLFFNNHVMQTKKWAADDNKKELLQPGNSDGSVNEEFTQAYGFNPFDPTTKATTPKIQGGLA